IGGQIDIGETEIQVPTSGFGLVGQIPDIKHIGASQGVTQSLARAGLLNKPSEETSKASGPIYSLDVLVRAPSKIFVRGRGLNAELGGELLLTGTTASIISAGRFDLIRGRLDLLARRFELDEGTIQMQGSLIPFIRFVSSTTESDFTATVIMEGPADEPKLSFESVPDAPDDEILAHLLFGKSVSDISALQAIQLANAVASLSGRGGIGIVENLRTGIGVDDLNVTTNDRGVTEVQVGKYLTDDIYTDVTAGSDGENELSINVDLSTSLRARGSVTNEGDSAIGLFFERDY
ncbi:MAG: translocation/assembly module TamB domain-containing protein, partial [Roseibium sp.]